MSWDVLDDECFEALLNNQSFSITDHGPLCEPVTRFSISRTENQKLLLTTHSLENSTRNFDKYPEGIAGTVRSNNDCITFFNGHMTVTAKGVSPFSTQTKSNYLANTFDKEEKSSLHSIECIPKDHESVNCLVEWVSNIDTSFFVWPHLCKEETQTLITRTLSGDKEPIVQQIKTTNAYTLRTCLRLKIGEHELYIGRSKNHEDKTIKGSGFILYKKFLSETIRQKIRECLSFTFGLPLIYSGYSLFANDFRILGFKAVTPYSFDQKAYVLHALPPAPISENSSNFIDASIFSHAVNRLYQCYDELNFSHISWLYWHAMCAPIHIIAVHLGSCIEALQTSHRELNPSFYSTQLLENKAANFLRLEYLKIVESMNIDETEKAVLKKKASSLNETPQKLRNERFFSSLFLEMAYPEKEAWKRRNDAAHGNKTKSDDYAQLIRDTKLLKNMVHRIILSIGQINSHYIDYYSPMFPIRHVKESVEAPKSGRFFAL